MAEIQLLSKHVSDLIAAGEVVERPASVVKELLENSLDAGACAVTVEIKNGGVSYIRVTDDGRGIAREDVPTAFLRHATSKIRSKEDLEAIGTLGFRGEALAAIASVSHIEMITKAGGDETGTHIGLDAGSVTFCRETGCPSGTTITVRELFYNTPARRKFLKRDASEAGSVQSVLERAALSRPDVSFKMIRDGQEILHTAGDNSLATAVYCLFGRQLYSDMIECTTDYEGVRVKGLVTRPTASRGNRNLQFFFINGRPVKNRILSLALEGAYKNTLMTGRFPACFLFMETDLQQVDVNVHPAKTEVKFSDERRVFDTVYFAVKAALDNDAFIPEMKPAETVKSERPLQDTVYQRPMDSLRFPETVLRQKPASYAAAPISAGPVLPSAPGPAEEELPFLYNEPLPEKEAHIKTPQRDYRIIGELFGIYFVVELGEEVLYIDKHAAHERMLFNQLKNNSTEPASQRLLTPVVVAVSAGVLQTITENTAVLAAAGIEAEPFGQSEVLVRSAPACMADEDIAPLIDELANTLINGQRNGAEGLFDEVFHTVACHSAVRAGDRLTDGETEVLVSTVLELADVKYCPHGRPVAVSMSRAQFERQFKRA